MRYFSASGKCSPAWPGKCAVIRQESTNAEQFQKAAGPNNYIGRSRKAAAL